MINICYDYLELVSSDDSTQLPATTHDNDSPTSPLDLSRTSTRFPFISPSMSIDDTPPSPIDVSAKVNYVDKRQMSIDYSYQEPIILTQTKPEWHYRSMKDLAKKHIPFLSGVGPQRTPIRIKVNF